MTLALLPLLSRHLPLVPVIERDSYPSRREVVELSHTQAPNLCFLDVVSDPTRSFALITELAALDPPVLVVVLLASNDPDLVLRCLRQGANEFLIFPFGGEELESTIERLSRLNPSCRGRNASGRVVALVPAKGGCGATTIATHLPYQWKRQGLKRILLADLDPLTGTIAFQLKVKSSYSFIDALNHSTTLDGDVWKALVTAVGGIDVLPAPENPADTMGSLGDAYPVVDFARQAYEAVVLDTSSAYGTWNHKLIQTADDVLLVTTNELPALQATQRALSYLERNRVDRSRIRLVVNRYSRENGLSREMIETALHTEVYHVCPEDADAVHRALLDGKPAPANTSFGKSMAGLADLLSGKSQQADEARGRESAFSSLLSIFSRG